MIIGSLAEYSAYRGSCQIGTFSSGYVIEGAIQGPGCGVDGQRTLE